MNKYNNTKAFSLIEMLIVLAIILILTALTAPNFTKQIESTRRTEARTTLLDYSMRFEEYYGSNFSYADADTYHGLSSSPQTENGYYQLTAIIPVDGESYTITATAIGTQASDTTCASLSVDNIGQKLPNDCW